jgi:serine protease
MTESFKKGYILSSKTGIKMNDAKINYKYLILAVIALTLSGIVGAANVNDVNDINVYSISTDQQPINALKEHYVSDEIVVKFKDRVKDEDISKLNERFLTSVLDKSKFSRFHRLRVPHGKTVSEMIESYKNDPNVEYAEPNYIAKALFVPNDPYFSFQWHLYNTQYGGINLVDAWNISTGSNVIVAVIDTGVAYENYCDSPAKCYYKASDLAGTQFVQGYDFINLDNHPNDDNSNGTHVAGTVAQSTNNN